MKLEDIPDKDGPRYPERINVAVSADTFKKLQALRNRGKKVPDFIRKVLELHLEQISL